METDETVLPFKRVSVTGGTGTVGSQCIKVLLTQFPHVEQVTTTCRDPNGPRVKRIPDSPRVNVVTGDIADPAVLRRVADESEVVFHLAAWLANLDMPPLNEVCITNSFVPGMLAKLCAAAGKRIVFTSSHSVYFAGVYEGHISEDAFTFRDDFVDWIEAVKVPYEALMDAVISGAVAADAVPGAIDEIHADHAPPFDPKIYDRDDYHAYCLTKLLAERFVLDHGGVVLRLANVYGPGDESTQAVGEACQRIMAADPAVETTINQPFKKLVPNYLGDIIKCLVRAGTLELSEGVSPVFTVASQEGYLREDALLRTVAGALNELRGTQVDYAIETLDPEEKAAFTYDLSKMRRLLLRGDAPTPFADGVREQLAWLIERAEGKPPRQADVTVSFGGV